MTTNNPMKDPAVAQKVAEKLRLRPFSRSPQGTEAISKAARTRMLSAANPMKDPEIAERVTAKQLATKPRTKTEVWFETIAAMIIPDLRWVGDGSLLVDGKCPDFQIGSTKLLIEVCQDWYFNSGKPVKRTVARYGIPRVKHFEQHGWRCLVVFMPSHRNGIPAGLLTALWFYSEVSLSGVWRRDEWFPFADSGDQDVSTTSSAKEPRRTRPTES